MGLIPSLSVQKSLGNRNGPKYRLMDHSRQQFASPRAAGGQTESLVVGFSPPPSVEFRRIVRAPYHPAAVDYEVAPTTNRPPHRGQQRYLPVTSPLYSPRRAGILTRLSSTISPQPRTLKLMESPGSALASSVAWRWLEGGFGWLARLFLTLLHLFSLFSCTPT